jgi:predicted MFS family arabinose efflux permease
MSRRQVFGSLCTLVFVMNLSRVIFAPLLEPLRLALTASSTELGLVATLAWIGSAAPRIPTGYLLTRYRRPTIILATGGFLTVAASVTAFAPTIEAVMIGAFLMGLSSGAYFMAANPLVSELFPDRPGFALGIHGASNQVAAVSAPIIVSGALVLDAAGVSAFGVEAWRLSLLAIAVVTAVSTLAFLAIIRRTTLPDSGSEDRDLVLAVRKQWRTILAGVLLLGTAGFVWNGVFNFYVTYLETTKDVTQSTARLYLMILFGSGIPAFAITGHVADRVRLVPLLMAIMAGFGVVLYALTRVTDPLVLGIVTFALGYVVHGIFPAIDTYLLGSMPDEHRASAYSVFSGGVMIVSAMGSSVVGRLLDLNFTFDTIFTGAVAGLGCTLVLVFVLYRAGRLPAGPQVQQAG